MIATRVIPCLLLRGGGLVKTVRFSDPVYLGDPVNIIRIFNDKEVDELFLVDIMASRERRPPPYEMIARITSECFMPLGYGGGVRTLDEMREIFGLGVEKVSLNTQAVENSAFVRAAANRFGSQSIVVSIDAKRGMFGRYEVYTCGGRKRTGLDPVDAARQMELAGAGEILLNSIDRDGTLQGYDLDLIRRVASAVNIPVVACGGAGEVRHLKEAVEEGGATAAAAGSIFVFRGRHRAVLISYPTPGQLNELFER
jgi:cyclase